MRRKQWYRTLVTALLLILLGSVAGCATKQETAQPSPPASSEQPAKKPAEFEVIALKVKPGTTVVDYPATVTATVVNKGELTGAYTASLLVDGHEVEKKVVSVAPGGSGSVSFQVARPSVGAYNLRVGELTTTLNVCDWAPQTIQYDSGVTELGTVISSKNIGHVVHFTPPGKPFKIQKVSIYGHVKTEAFQNIRELDERTFTVRVWDWHRTKQLWSTDLPWSLFSSLPEWRDISVPDVVVDGDFFVEVVTNSDPPPSQKHLYIYCEQSKGELRSSWSVNGEIYTTEDEYVKDKRWCIRVKGQGPAVAGKQEDLEEPEEIAGALTTLAYEDDFSNPASGFGGTSTETVESYYKDGEFHGVVKAKNWLAWAYNTAAGQFKNFVLEVDARKVSGPRYARYGLVFRCRDDSNFYYFVVADDGRYRIGKRVGGQWALLHGWTRSGYINKDRETNHLKVVCLDSTIAVYVNGHFLTSVTDGSFGSGYIGGIVWSWEPEVHVAFDNLKVYTIK